MRWTPRLPAHAPCHVTEAPRSAPRAHQNVPQRQKMTPTKPPRGSQRAPGRAQKAPEGGPRAHSRTIPRKYMFLILENGPKKPPREPQRTPQRAQDAMKNVMKTAFEGETSKTSKMMTLSMKMLDFGARRGSKIHNFRSRNGFNFNHTC